MDMRMPDIDGPRRPEVRADGRFARLPITAMTASASLADREACPAAGMNDHVAKPSTKNRWCFACSVISAGAAPEAAAADAGELVRARGRYRRAFRRQLELIVGVARRSFGFMQDLFAQLERQLGGRCPGQRRDPAYHQGQRFHRWRQPRRPRASELERGPAAAPIRGAYEILAGIRLDELRTLCDACLLRLQAMFGDVQASRRAEPRCGGCLRQGFRRTRGSPASAAAIGRITPWALSADTPEARPGLERHPLPVVQCLPGVAQQVVGVEQGVGDFGRFSVPRRMAAGIAWRVLRQSPGCSSKRMRMPRMLRTSPKAGAIRRRMPSCSLMRRSRCSRVFPRGCRASRRAARRCSSPAGQEEDATVRAGASVRSRSQTQAPGGQGWRRGGEALMATS